MDTIDYELLHDHAVIRFSGELTWESATELANLIDTLTMRYFYKRIELVIHSPGGLAAALEHLARAITNLVPGECYVALADGRLERRQLERFLFEENADRMRCETVADTASACAQHRVRRRKRRGRGTSVER